jgi:hypothetical protein
VIGVGRGLGVFTAGHSADQPGLDGARWVYDSDELGAIRRDLMTILTHHAASRQAAMAPYGRMLLSGEAG